jgi:hypothetical protein
LPRAGQKGKQAYDRHYWSFEHRRKCITIGSSDQMDGRTSQR